MKESIQRTWKNGLVLDWFPPQKAKTMPQLEHYVGLRWTKVGKEFENYKENLTSIFDLFRIRASEGKHGPHTCILKVCKLQGKISRTEGFHFSDLLDILCTRRLNPHEI